MVDQRSRDKNIQDWKPNFLLCEPVTVDPLHHLSELLKIIEQRPAGGAITSFLNLIGQTHPMQSYGSAEYVLDDL